MIMRNEEMSDEFVTTRCFEKHFVDMFNDGIVEDSGVLSERNNEKRVLEGRRVEPSKL